MSKTKEGKKKNWLIILLVLLLLAISLGYAAFSTNLAINGSVTGSANWNIIFTDTAICNADQSIAAASKGTAAISDDGTVITASVNLAYPGDGALIKAVVTNKGNIDAIVKNININNIVSSKDITITTPSISDGGFGVGEIVPANGTCTFYIAVKWNTDSTTVATADNPISASFKFTVEYEQSTSEQKVSPYHEDGEASTSDIP